MKRLSIIVLVLFSFFYANKVSNYIILHTTVVKKIKKIEGKYTSNFDNAVYNHGEVIPGLNGKSIDYIKSYYNLKDSFDESRLIFKEDKPTLSINDIKEGILIKGNNKKRCILLVVDDSKLMEILDTLKVTYSVVTTSDNNTYKISKDSKLKISPNKRLDGSNYYTFEPENGDLIYLDKSLNKLHIEMIIRAINYRNITIVTYKEFISEKNS